MYAETIIIVDEKVKIIIENILKKYENGMKIELNKSRKIKND